MVTCTKCNNSFEPTPEQNSLIEQIASKGGGLVMLNCEVCMKLFPYNAPTENIQEDDVGETPFLCPVPHCGGWVSYIDDETPPFYGCGECGSVWKDKKSLDKDISRISKRYAYRTAAYKWVDRTWFPASYEELPDNLMEQIENEPFDVK